MENDKVLAHLLVNYSVSLKKGEKVFVEVTDVPDEFVLDLLEEIAKVLNIDKEEITVSLDSIQEPISLQEPIYNEGAESIYLIDQIKDSKNTDEFWTESLSLAEAMKKLNSREKLIISKRFFDGRTQMEIANEIGISQAQVSRLEKNAIERIKKLYS